MNYAQCVNGFETCENMKFNTSTFQATFNFEKTLVPGFGCFIEISRTLNGSWGELSAKPLSENDKKNLLLFDDTDLSRTWKAADGMQDYKTGMQYTDNGWLSKKVFIANRSERQFATFQYTFNLSLLLRPQVGLVLSCVLAYFSIS